MEELKIELIQHNWSPSELFSVLESTNIPNKDELREERREKLWKDTYAEYDARHLEKEVRNRGLVNSPEMDAFLQIWNADEIRHTNGFVHLLELITDYPQERSWENLNKRGHDFSGIEKYLESEFSVLVAIAFDEIVTCNAYNEDREFYRSLNNERFTQWLTKLVKDEAAHFRNAVNVIRLHHHEKIAEIPSLLESLVKVRGPEEYNGTFILDHFGEDYTLELLSKSRESLLNYVNRPND